MIDLEELKSAISKFSPILGSAISVVNPVAGAVVTGIAELFGANSIDPKDIISKIQADPNAATKLKEYEIAHQDLLVQSALQDKESAREREEEIVKDTGKRDWVLEFIAIFVVFGFFTMCFLVSIMIEDKADHDILYMLIGQLTSGFVMVLSYYFGATSAVK